MHKILAIKPIHLFVSWQDYLVSESHSPLGLKIPKEHLTTLVALNNPYPQNQCKSDRTNTYQSQRDDSYPDKIKPKI